MKTAAAVLIDEYIQAFKGANKMNDPPSIEYWRGWFIFKTPRHYQKKYRRKTVIAMRDTLRTRALAEKH